MTFYCEQVQDHMTVVTDHRPESVSAWARTDEWPVSFGVASTKRNPVYDSRTGNYSWSSSFDVSWVTPWAEHWDGRSPWVVRDFIVVYTGPAAPHPSTMGRYLVTLSFVETGLNEGQPCPLFRLASASFLSVVATFATNHRRVNVVGHDGTCVSRPVELPAGGGRRVVKTEYLFEGSTMPFRNQLQRDEAGALVTLPDTRKRPRRVVRRRTFVDPQIEV